MVDHDLALAREEAEGADTNHLVTGKARWGSNQGSTEKLRDRTHHIILLHIC
jgi:hypothetical protein